MTLSFVVAVVMSAVGMITFFMLRLWWVREHERTYFRALAKLSEGGLGNGAPMFRDEDAFVRVQRAGRAVTITLGHSRDFWEPGLIVACGARIFFDVGHIDGHKSYVRQLPDEKAREAVWRFVQQHHVRGVGIDAVPAVVEERLRVTLSLYQGRRSPAPTIVQIVDDAVGLATLLEARFGKVSPSDHACIL
jgi:hypothetical protein